MATTTYLRLFPAVKQFELKNGALNVGGRLFVYYEGTDDLAEIYDENGTRLQQPAILDNDGRALGLFVDAKKVYRLEVQDAFGAMQFTVRKMVPSGGGAGSALDNQYDIISSDGSITVDKYDDGGVTKFDIGLGPNDSDEFLEWIKCSEEDCGSTWIPAYQSGTMETSVDGIKVHGGHLYHFTSTFYVDPDGTGINYDTFKVLMYCGDTVVDSRDFDIDSSLNDAVQCEFSTDVVPEGDSVVYFRLTIPSTCEVTAEVQAHRIYSGINAVPDTCATKQWVEEYYSELSRDTQANWTEADTSSPAYIKNKPDLSQYVTDSEMESILSGYATTGDLQSGLATKQDTISDLSAIRAGAQAGSTAVQPAALNDYATTSAMNTALAGKQDVLTPGENISISNNVISANPQRQADWAQSDSSAVDYIRNKPDLSAYATDAELEAGLSTKQGVINDLDQIRSGAAAGATAVQFADLAAVAISGDYDDLSNRPAIPSGPQLVPAATSADADKVLTVDSQGVPAWAEAQAPISAGTGIDITGNTISVDSTTVAMKSDLPDLTDYVTDTELSTILQGYQEALTAGSNIQISNGTISATDTTYTAGTGLDLAGTEFSVDTTTIATKSDLSSYTPTASLGAVALSNDYDDLDNKPTIPVVPPTKELVAGNNITLTEGANDVTVACTVTIGTVSV